MKIERIGEVCLLTADVVRLADFYRELLGLGGYSSDPVHQFLIENGTALTVMKDDSPRTGQGVTLAFTVEDMDAAFERVQTLGAEIVEPPTKRPWVAVNLSFRDPDGNLVYFRSFHPGENEPFVE